MHWRVNTNHVPNHECFAGRRRSDYALLRRARRETGRSTTSPIRSRAEARGRRDADLTILRAPKGAAQKLLPLFCWRKSHSPRSCLAARGKNIRPGMAVANSRQPWSRTGNSQSRAAFKKLDRESFDRIQKPKIKASDIMRKFFYGITALSCLAWCGTSIFAQAGGGGGAGGAGASGSAGAGGATGGAGASASPGSPSSSLSNPGSESSLSQPNPSLSTPSAASPNLSSPPGQTGSTFQGSGQARSTLPSTASPGINAGGRANIDINALGVGVDVNANRGSGANVDINRQGRPDISARIGGGGAQPGANINVGNDNWRMVRYNNEWWYYTPQNSWMYYRDNNWSAYDAGTFRPLQRYRTAFRGLNQNMDERREMRDTVRDSRNENRDTRIDARQGNRDQIQDNRDKVRDERREMRNDIQDNRLTNPVLPGNTQPTPGSAPGAQIPSLPTPGTTNTDGSIGGAAGGN
jgi:hypothetical protein